MRAGLIAAHLAKAGAQDLSLSLFLNGNSADDLLHKLGTAGRPCSRAERERGRDGPRVRRAQLGDRYALLGSGPDVWDCSGLTRAAYAAAGIYIGAHSATNQYKTMAGRGRPVPFSQVQAGDLVFWGSGGGLPPRRTLCRRRPGPRSPQLHPAGTHPQHLVAQ